MLWPSTWFCGNVWQSNLNWLEQNCFGSGMCNIRDGHQNARKRVSPVCVTNNTLHSLFSRAKVFLNGILISLSNNAYHHFAFFEIKLTTDWDAKATGARTQGYQYQADKSNEKNVNEWEEKLTDDGKKQQK